jgi:hypothetical protein
MTTTASPHGGVTVHRATPDVEPVSVAATSGVRRAVMLQGWRDLASIHWRYDPAVVQALLPSPYHVDTFDGAAWVGVIPFRMERVRIPGLPPLGPLSTFPETNVRTYVVDRRGRRGVWFASLDVSRLLPALVARTAYQLPYAWSRMSIAQDGDEVRYRSRRRWPRGDATSDLRLRVGEPIDPGSLTALDHFLTARWALGSTLLGRPLWAAVEHGPWPLHRAALVGGTETLTIAAGLPSPAGPPHVLWSPGVEVRIGAPHTIRRRPARRGGGGSATK